MKKLLYLFIASTLLFSCETNDNEILLDPIIGKWQLQSILEDNNEKTTECQRKTILTFLGNGTTTNENFYDDGNGCENKTLSSTWANLGNSTYRIESDSENIKAEFSQKNTVFSATSIGEERDNMGNIVATTIVITLKKI